MRFESPYWLLLLLVPPIFWTLWWKRLSAPKVMYSLPVPKSLRARDPRWILLGLRTVAWIALVIALARPQRVTRQIERQASGVEILLILDISASMEVEDMADRSRLDLAKDTLRQFIEARQTDRIGLEVFSGEAVTLIPPTLDYGLLFSALKQVETGVLKDGTAIGDGLAVGVQRLKHSTAKSRVIVLLTDGDSNVGQVSPVTAGELAAGFGIRVYTIAIGKEGRVRVPIKQRGIFGQKVVTYQVLDSTINPELLQKIAAMTKAKFFRATEGEALTEIFQEIDHLEKNEIQIKERVESHELFRSWLLLALLLIFAELGLRLGGWAWIP